MGLIGVSSSLTAIAGTPTYTAGDLIEPASGAAMKFQLTRFSAGRGEIVGARLRKSTNVTSNAVFTLRLYDAEPELESGVGDEGAYSVTDAARWIGDIVFTMTSGALVGSDGNLTGFGTLARRIFADLYGPAQDNFARAIYAHLISTGTYQRGAAEVFAPTLWINSEEG